MQLRKYGSRNSMSITDSESFSSVPSNPSCSKDRSRLHADGAVIQLTTCLLLWLGCCTHHAEQAWQFHTKAGACNHVAMTCSPACPACLELCPRGCPCMQLCVHVQTCMDDEGSCTIHLPAASGLSPMLSTQWSATCECMSCSLCGALQLRHRRRASCCPRSSA